MILNLHAGFWGLFWPRRDVTVNHFKVGSTLFSTLWFQWKVAKWKCAVCHRKCIEPVTSNSVVLQWKVSKRKRYTNAVWLRQYNYCTSIHISIKWNVSCFFRIFFPHVHNRLSFILWVRSVQLPSTVHSSTVLLQMTLLSEGNRMSCLLWVTVY